MLSLLKKGPGSSGRAHAPGWHPNFRNFTQLPDTKVVRTSFLFTGIAGFVATAIFTFFCYQEYNLYLLEKQVDEWTAKIEQRQKPSSQAIAAYKAFQEEQKKLAEAEDFLASEKLPFTEFLIHLGEKLPRYLAITYINYNAAGVTIRGLVKGEPDQASGLASAYEKQLREDAETARKFGSISITTLSRDAQSGQLSFEIMMKFEEVGKKK